jgi:hypothetical protein
VPIGSVKLLSVYTETELSALETGEICGKRAQKLVPEGQLLPARSCLGFQNEHSVVRHGMCRSIKREVLRNAGFGDYEDERQSDL